MKKMIGLFVCLLLIGSQIVNAQSKQITGTVTSAEDGLGMPGVSVVIKGTTIGASTDIDGKYTLKAEASDVLMFSFVGMISQEITVGNKNIINVVLKSESIGVEEVVVVGYGTQTREAATGSVGVVGSEDLETVPVENVSKALQGKIAGVQVNSATGQPGAATQIRIRGFSSVNAGMEPLYVIDGVPVATGNYSYFTSTGNVLASLNPKDIESMTILKDAAAASIYGSRAANGVILITTKSGKEGKTRIRFNASYGISNITNDQDYGMMNPEELYGYMRTAIINTGYDPTTYDGLTGTPAGFFASETLPNDVETFDWEDDMFREATTQEYQLSFSGGSQKTKFFISGNYLNQEGIMVKTDLERFSFRSNIDHEVNDYLKVGVKVNGTHTEQNDRPNDGMYYANPFWAGRNILPWHLPYNEDGSFNFNIPSNQNTNPKASAEFNDQWEKQWKFNGSAYLTITPIKGLELKTLNSIEYLDGEGRRFWDPRSDDQTKNDAEKGTLQISNTRLLNYNTSNTISYKTILDEVHSVRVLAGIEAQDFDYQEHYASGEELGYVIPYLSNSLKEKSTADYGWSRYTLLSYLGILEYNYDSKYYFKGSFRRDGSSRFGEDTRWGSFWSVGASWSIHNESFMDNIQWINMLKLRASYGISGNDGIGNYDQYGVYGTSAYNGYAAATPASIPNPDLGWEENAAFNIGLDFKFLNRFDGTLEYYKRVTSEMLLDVPLSRTSGFSSMRQNIGEMENSGIEFNINAEVLRGDFNLDIFANVAYNKVELTDLAGEEEISDGFWRRHRLGGGFADYYVYDYAGVDPANGMGLWRTADGDMTYEYSKANRIYKGQVEPDYVGGFGLNFSWKGLSLLANFEYKLGHSVYVMESRYTNSDGASWGTNQSKDLLRHWKKPGDITDVPKPLINNSSGANEWGTSRYLYKGDYLRFKTLTLAYQLPRTWIEKAKLSQAKVYVSADNLYCWHNVPYYDPERNVTGGGYTPYPQTRTITFGVELGL